MYIKIAGYRITHAGSHSQFDTNHIQGYLIGIVEYFYNDDWNRDSFMVKKSFPTILDAVEDNRRLN